MDQMRHYLPTGVIPSKRQLELWGQKKVEFELVMAPKRAATGWFINLSRLIQLLKYFYFWLRDDLVLIGDCMGMVVSLGRVCNPPGCTVL
jgi:hypothetical protein